MSDDVLRRDAELNARLADTNVIEELRRMGHRNRTLIRLLSVLIVLNILLTAGLAVSAVRSTQALNQAVTTQAQLRALCLSGNESRTAQAQLWDYVLQLPPISPRTPEQQLEVDAIRAYVHQLFALRKC